MRSIAWNARHQSSRGLFFTSCARRNGCGVDASSALTASVLHRLDVEVSVAKKAGRKTTRKRAPKRQLINTGSDKRYVRRGSKGRFKESDDAGRSLASD